MSSFTPALISHYGEGGTATFANVVVSLWVGEPAREQVEGWIAAHRVAYTHGTVLSVNVCEKLRPVFREPFRAAITKSARETAGEARGTCIVLPSGGFVVATVRAFVSGLSLITDEPTEVFRAEYQIRDWFRRMAPEHSTDELVNACDGALALIRAEPAVYSAASR